MVPVIYAPEAERDLDAITAYIAKDNPKAAEQSGYRLIARADWCAELHRLRGVFLASIGGDEIRIEDFVPQSYQNCKGPEVNLTRCARGGKLRRVSPPKRRAQAQP